MNKAVTILVYLCEIKTVIPARLHHFVTLIKKKKKDVTIKILAWLCEIKPVIPTRLPSLCETDNKESCVLNYFQSK